jgi:hypothetical protein
VLDNWLKVVIPFVAGLDTKAATAVVPPDRLAVLENGVFTKQGAVAKRYGTTEVPAWTAAAELDGTARGVFDGNGALALATTKQLYTRVGGLWAERGRYAAVTYRAAEVAHANRSQTAADSATANGVTAVVWKYAANSLYFQLFNADRVPLSPVTALATATADYPAALAVGDNILLTWADTSTDDLKARVIRTADIAGSLATANVVTLRTDLTSSRAYSVCEATADYGLLVWSSDGTALSAGITVAKVNNSGTVSATAVISADGANQPPAVAYNADTDEVCVAWPEFAGTVQYRVLDSDLAGGTETSTLVATSGRVAVAPSSSDDYSFTLATETLGGSDDLNRVTLYRTDGSSEVIRHAHLASRGMQLSEQGCFLLGHESRTGLQNGYFLYADDGYLIGAFESATAVDRSASPELPGLSGGRLAVLFQRSLDVDDFKAQYGHSGIRLLTFTEDGRVSTARLGESTYLSGCQLWAFDGDQPVESGFHMFPDVKTADLVENAAGANLEAKQYNYRFYYEWYNSRGERCRSLPMQRSVTVAVAGSRMDIAIPTLRHTLKSATYGRQAEVSIVVYRTEGDASNVYYRVSSPDPTTAGATNGYVANSFSADSAVFVDDLADGDITDNERDMFSLAELLNSPVPGPEVLYATQDRLYLVGGSVPKGSVLPSKQHNVGDMAEIAFENEARPCTEEITALGSINEVVVAFTERQAHALSGPGFDNAGGGQPFGTGRITSDVGCTDPGSVVMIPGGLLFKSAKGIYGMDQSFNVEYVGARPSATTARRSTPPQSFRTRTTSCSRAAPGAR